MLEIEFEKMTPNLLRQFIIAHEFGHAIDYVKNYENNTDFNSVEASEEWEFHYYSNLDSMPVPGFDPVDLRNETSKFNSLDEFLVENPNISKMVEKNKIKTLQDLLDVQELAYRNSSYESYADNFATDFLKKNAEQLNILELIS